MSLHFTYVIALNRYLSIANTAWNNKLNGGRRKYALLYIPSSIVALISLIFSVEWKEEITSCSMHAIFGTSPSAFGIYVTTVYLPVLIGTLVVYALAIRAIHKHFSQVLPVAIIPTNGGPNGADVRRKRQMASLKTVGVIIGLVMILTSPIVFSSVFGMLQLQVDRYFHVMCGIGSLMNSALNPIVYTWRMRDVRKEIRSIFCSCLR